MNEKLEGTNITEKQVLDFLRNKNPNAPFSDKVEHSKGQGGDVYVFKYEMAAEGDNEKPTHGKCTIVTGKGMVTTQLTFDGKDSKKDIFTIKEFESKVTSKEFGDGKQLAFDPKHLPSDKDKTTSKTK